MDMPFIPADLMSTADVAKLLNVKPRTIRRWIKNGTLPAFRVGAHLRVSRADAMASVSRVEPDSGLRVETRAEVQSRAAHVDAVLRKMGVRKEPVQVESPSLRGIESCILQAAPGPQDDAVSVKRLAKLAGYSCSSYFREVVRVMTDAGLLRRITGGLRKAE